MSDREYPVMPGDIVKIKEKVNEYNHYNGIITELLTSNNNIIKVSVALYDPANNQLDYLINEEIPQVTDFKPDELILLNKREDSYEIINKDVSKMI